MDHVGPHVSGDFRLGDPLVAWQQVEHFYHLVALLFNLVVLDAVEVARWLHRVCIWENGVGLHGHLMGLQLDRCG